MKAQYGEPWRVTDTRIMSVNNRVVLETNDIDMRDRLFRIVACVNTLSGTPDEALDKVRELVEACRALQETAAVYDRVKLLPADEHGDAFKAFYDASVRPRTLCRELGQLLAKVRT